MHPSPRSIPAIHLGWQITPWTGWGRYGLNLARELRQCGYAVVVDGIAESRHLSPSEQQSLAGMTIVSERSSDAPPIPVAVSLQSFGNRGSCSPRSPAIQAERTVGVIFSEDTRWQPDEVARINQCEAVIAGSSWHAAVLRAAGVHNVATILQGIAADLWCQTAPDPGFAERFAGRYLVFSGGKLEFRKGQDIVVAAFRRFHRQHPDAVLVTAWQNPWPQTMLGLGLAGHVEGLPEVVKRPAGDSLDLHSWAAAQGIERSAFVDLGLLAGHELPRIVKACDMAVFANRAEGGTNLVASIWLTLPRCSPTRDLCRQAAPSTARRPAGEKRVWTTSWPPWSRATSSGMRPQDLVRRSKPAAGNSPNDSPGPKTPGACSRCSTCQSTQWLVNRLCRNLRR